MGRDKGGECGNVDFFFLRFGNDDVGVRGVSSSFTSEFELRVQYFFVRGSIYRSPTTSVLGSFFVINAKSISDRCRSFKYKFVLLGTHTPPLQMLEVKIDWD